MSKSDRTRQRHAKAFQGQRQLTAFGFKAPSNPARVLGPKMKAAANPPMSMQDVEPQLIVQPNSSMSLDPSRQIGRPAAARTRSATVLSDPSTDDEAAAASGPGDVAEMDALGNDNPESLVDNMNDEELEDWEADLDESVQGPKAHVRDWTDLRQQIKDHLKKNSKTLFTLVSIKPAPHHLKLRNSAHQRCLPHSGKL
jgi:hypothetical protein